MAKADSKSYSKNLFTTKNIVIYVVVGAIVYFLAYKLFLKGSYNQNYNYTPATTQTQPAATPAVTSKMTVNLAAENGSGQSGTATLTENSGKTTVSISTTPGPAGVSQPAHIHLGACPGVGAVKYPLTNVSGGKSETTINVTLAQLKAMEPLAINVHKSAQSSGTYVACGPLK